MNDINCVRRITFWNVSQDLSCDNDNMISHVPPPPLARSSVFFMFDFHQFRRVLQIGGAALNERDLFAASQPTTKVRAGQSSRRLASHCATNVNLPVNIFHKISNANFGSLLHSLPYCSSQSSMVHWLSSSISPCSVVCPSVPLW